MSLLPEFANYYFGVKSVFEQGPLIRQVGYLRGLE